ncbi:TetR family transcriptional regulator [Siphonobacter sp. BAB-5385]|uniref:TetR/AcrR family transcriptional regulator n=1 Tax=Siphonobacter curvatus TaxID=2094562 RepID=A0A2S7IQG7_9BACT|nr:MULTISPECIES: TetR/AcrR family transcriptional regulator [Siphonobacter]OZI05194.1 TetR family transcriptional regulator [Siphonobacter sp. BAB-5385]PMD98841.1 TetR family transcriptional regulator [Siphonobacter sp. BAB-5405]PQA59916.1 TetR/AcrR family transcriptional regulator [Siphonobacter curvatus]
MAKRLDTPKKSDRPLDKRTAILEATLDLISKNGFHATPMSMVAQHANVAAGTIYHYFESKEQLIDELFLLYRDKIALVIQESDDTTKPYRDRFRSVFLGLYDYYVSHPDQFLFIEHYANSPIMNKLSKEEMFNFYQPLWEFLRKGIHTGQLKDISSRLMAWMVYGNITAVVKMKLSGDLTLDVMLLNTAVNTVWEGLKRG